MTYKNKELINNVYLDTDIDERFEVIDVYYGSIRNCWVAMVEFEHGKVHRYPAEDIVNKHNFHLLEIN